MTAESVLSNQQVHVWAKQTLSGSTAKVTNQQVSVWHKDHDPRPEMTWKSKPLRVPTPICPAAVRIYADGPVMFNMWADGAQIVTNRVIANNVAERLPSGYKAREFQVQLSGTAKIDSVAIANSVAELT